jgi:hypothetical protein
MTKQNVPVITENCLSLYNPSIQAARTTINCGRGDVHYHLTSVCINEHSYLQSRGALKQVFRYLHRQVIVS